MSKTEIGPILTAHHAEILKNNLEFVEWLSPLDGQGLDDLLQSAPYARQIDDGQGVLIAFTSGQIYESAHVDWLKARFDNFVYVDRVIIAASAQGRGYGGRLYDALEMFARENGYDHIVCEVNTVPDNPGSHVFHQNRGFSAQGEVGIKDGVKRYRYYAKRM